VVDAEQVENGGLQIVDVDSAGREFALVRL